ncbi:YfgM family protein [Acinetobacter shaoyimingii]|uniref:Ancillary SecYEG translocon subunit n=1 Tax=Acinetobacter shaoyimingii TaxID=2715164 RepID=A0A6G8RY98_9GAMM|nr:tetratricopeptide repeat protein [Acinetobacter shaoyimingii]QIO06877.1 tetratricopeptide repeat protein [Acinetobacter shaoyimingii]
MSALTDEEQLDSLKSFSKKYGSAMVSGVLVALIAFFGWNYWQKKQSTESQVATAKLQVFLEEARASSTDPKLESVVASSAEKLVKDNPDTIQALHAQFVMAKLAFDKQDYAKAERELKKVENTKIKDEGLQQIVKIRVADAQLAQKKFDEAIKTLSGVTSPAFKTTVEEMRGDIYVAKNDTENAKKAYLNAWNNLIESKQERQILQIKLESVGVLVDDPEIERPILATKMDES